MVFATRNDAGCASRNGKIKVMGQLQDAVRHEVEELHRFFVAWFNGTVEQGSLDAVLLPRLDDRMLFVSPDGDRLWREDIMSVFRRAFGTNPAFRIQIRDVEILREIGDHLLVTYSEWQKGAGASSRPENARFTTALLTKEQPFRWLHVHETWLPEAESAAGPYDF